MVTLSATALTSPTGVAPVRPAMLVVTADDLPARPPVPTPVRVSISRIGVTATKSPPGPVSGAVVAGVVAAAGTVVAGASVVVGATVVDAVAATVVAADVASSPPSRDATM